MKEEDISILMSTFFASISIVDFKTVLDITLLVLSILNILIVILIKFKRYIKDKKLDENEIEDLNNDLKNLNDTIKEGVENGRSEKQRNI